MIHTMLRFCILLTTHDIRIYTIYSFFSEHLIEDFGCVGWNANSKITLALIEKKLEALFAKEAQCDGHHYDTFIIFYNGIADKDGSWILAGIMRHFIECNLYSVTIHQSPTQSNITFYTCSS